MVLTGSRFARAALTTLLTASLGLQLAACSSDGTPVEVVEPTGSTTSSGTGSATGGTTGTTSTTSGDATTGGGQDTTSGGDTDSTGADTGGQDTGTTGSDPCGGTCDDGNNCTKDVCYSDGTCEHLAETKEGCVPTLIITDPPRAAWLLQADSVPVKGTAVSLQGAGKLSFGGIEIPVAVDGAFESAIAFPEHGVNLVVAEYADSVGKARHVQSFVMGQFFYDVLDGPKEDAKVDNGLTVFLGAELWDDDDTSDLDDVASFVHKALEGIDIVSLIPTPLTPEGEEPGFGWCSWSVTVSDIDYSIQDVDVKTTNGGLILQVELTNISVSFAAIAPAFACPDAIGSASTDLATGDVVAKIALLPSGEIKVTVDPADVSIVIGELDFDITEGATSWLDFLFNWFSGSIENWFETGVENALVEVVAPLVSGLLDGIGTWVQTFDIPPFLGGSQPVSVTAVVSPSFLSLEPSGAVIGLGVSATTPKGASWLAAPGSLARFGCFDGVEPPLDIPKDKPVTMAVHDDVLNQALFAAWWGGILNVQVDESLVQVFVPDLEVEGLEITVDPKSPPIVTSCVIDGQTHLQIGDMRVLTTFDVNGEPAAIEALVTASFEASISVAQAPGATLAIGFGIHDVHFLDFHLVGISGAIQGKEALLEELMRALVQNLIVEALGESAFEEFPIPQFDLSTFIPGLPPNTVLSFDPGELTRQHGYSIIEGAVTD
ncbi:MAG: hypothetical protein ACI9WU_000825 [Myxococcota bacterium]|jgi:hypothetical protein